MGVITVRGVIKYNRVAMRLKQQCLNTNRQLSHKERGKNARVTTYILYSLPNMNMSSCVYIVISIV